MREQTVAMYCVLDDLGRLNRPAGARPAAAGRRLTDAQVLTIALVAARFFGGNLMVAKHYLEQHAVTAAGFALKIALCIFAHALHQAGL